jgi:hypothetical protein
LTPDPNFLVFLLIGQSNMEGIPLPQELDLAEHERVRVLAYDNVCGREYNRWYQAAPPLHSHGTGIGPGDYFARTLIATLPRQFKVGLVPCGIKGVDIDFFRKGVVSRRRGEFPIPPDNHWTSAYDWVVSRAQLAQHAGVIRGILFHQGESDCGDPEWIAKVSRVVADLHQDLGLSEAVPFLAGELCHGGCCAAHNALVHQLPNHVPNCHVVSASGLQGMDEFHFDLPGQRELGARFGRTMLETVRIS